MSSSNIITAKAVRNTRKIERPRPLRQESRKSSTIGDELITDLETLHMNLSNCNFAESVFDQVQQACNGLKAYGAQLETKFKDDLDRYFVSFRNASRDDRVDRLSRLRILEAIELRAMGWKQNDEISKYYQNKFIELENILERGPAPALNTGIQQSSSFHSIPISLTQGEILKTSGKFSKATKIPGKNYFKDEIVIRNSDSGKVAQGVKERLVQITGPHEDAIGSAKTLIEDTIRRNASPVREKSERTISKSLSSNSIDSNGSEDSGTSISTSQDSAFKVSPILHSYSVNDASRIRDYQYTVMVNHDAIRISGSNLDKVRTAKLVLEEYFAGQAESSGYSSCNHSFTDVGNARRPLSMYASYGNMSPNSYLNGSEYEATAVETSQQELSLVPLQRSKSIPIEATSSGSSLQSSTEEETYKGESSTTEDEKVQSNFVKSKKTTLNRSFSASGPELKSEDKLSTNHSASFRRAQFAKAATINSDTGITKEPVSSSNVNSMCNGYKISYPRNFLLECAKSPFSTLVPKDLTNLVQDLPFLFKKTPEMFDPDEYKERIIVCVPQTRFKESPLRQLSHSNEESCDQDVF